MNDFDHIDVHVHTSYSQNDCKQPMGDYLTLLREGKAKGFGFADHMHPPSEAMSDIYDAMNAYRFRGEDYLQEIRAAQAEGLNAYAGIEVTYESAWDDVCRSRANEYDFDYRIASPHSFDGFWVTRDYYRHVQPGAMMRDLVNRYYDAVLDALALDWADVIAHIGVYRRFLPDSHQLMICAQETIEQREDEVAKACAKSSKIIEINTSSLDAPGQCTMPTFAFLEKYKKFSGDTICLSGDAHELGKVNAGFAQTAQRLKDMGFTKLTMPWAKDEPVLL